ncbi:hypothetical protein QE250_07830 [Chromatiaceae bacterium AAb-1]|nr:hypothetical protein [Chromatiaceae bacterium AAb-1]
MRNFVVFSAAIALAACSTTPVTRSQSQLVSSAQVLAPELQTASPERTLPVLLVRDAGFMGSFVDAIVAIDGKNAVVLAPEQRFEFYLAPGNYMFSIKPAKNPLSEPMAETDIEIRPEGTNSFRLRLVSGDGARIERSLQIQD